MAEVSIGPASSLPEGGRLSGVVDGRAVLALRLDGKLYCVEDICSHDGQPLTDGPVSGCQIECPRHGARFDLATGRAMCMPAIEGIRTFSIREQGGQVVVDAG